MEWNSSTRFGKKNNEKEKKKELPLSSTKKGKYLFV
jgi:hypothetical protein